MFDQCLQDTREGVSQSWQVSGFANGGCVL